MEKILAVHNVEKSYGIKGNITRALNKVSFTVHEGEFIGIMGASGSGKTTLLNCIATIDRATAGQIYLGGKDITKLREEEIARFRRGNLGFIFQDFNLLDTLTIEENIALSLVINQVDPGVIDSRVKDISRRLGIDQLLTKFPYEVSGGQKQRCACCRAIVSEPKLILADEPTGALDSKSAQLFLETLEGVNQKMQATILMVTHDSFSASYCNRILFLKDGEIFNEIRKAGQSRPEFYRQILANIAYLGGERHVS